MCCSWWCMKWCNCVLVFVQYSTKHYISSLSALFSCFSIVNFPDIAPINTVSVSATYCMFPFHWHRLLCSALTTGIASPRHQLLGVSCEEWSSSVAPCMFSQCTGLWSLPAFFGSLGLSVIMRIQNHSILTSWRVGIDWQVNWQLLQVKSVMHE